MAKERYDGAEEGWRGMYILSGYARARIIRSLIDRRSFRRSNKLSDLAIRIDRRLLAGIARRISLL